MRNERLAQLIDWLVVSFKESENLEDDVNKWFDEHYPDFHFHFKITNENGMRWEGSESVKEWLDGKI